MVCWRLAGSGSERTPKWLNSIELNNCPASVGARVNERLQRQQEADNRGILCSRGSKFREVQKTAYVLR